MPRDVPPSITVIVCPAAEMRAVRGTAPEFTAPRNETVPFPDPIAGDGDVIGIQEASVVADHVQLLAETKTLFGTAFTARTSAAPLLGIDMLGGVTR